MNKYFICKLCDKSIEIKSKNKHLSFKYHKSLSMSIISRYSVTNPDFLHIKFVLKIYVLDYIEKFGFYLIICEWKLHFSDTIISVKPNTWYNVSAGYYLRGFVLSKIKYYDKRGHKFSHISEMNITFISDRRNMTYEYYLIQPKPLLECKIECYFS